LATKVYHQEDIELQDEESTVVTVRPLNIKRLRRFMEIVKNFDEEAGDEGNLDLMVDAVAIAIERSNPELAKDKDTLEEALDIPTIWKILEIAGGVTNDPNPTPRGPTGRT
jgi:hypothetical protein